MIDITGHRVDLPLLSAELTAAGVPHQGLGTRVEGAQTLLHTYAPDAGALVPSDLPPEAIPVVDAHVAPPLVIEHVETRLVEAVTRTTDGAFREIWRLTTQPKRVYRAALEMRATDATDGTTRAQEARLVFKGLSSSVVQVGATAVLWSAADAAATGWTIQAQVQGTDLLFGVRGAAGRTIDWSVDGSLVLFGPEGLVP